LNNTIQFELRVLLIGLAVAVVLLYLLYLILSASKRISKIKNAEPKVEASPQNVQEAITVAPVTAALSKHTYHGGEDTVAAIAAAVTACLGAPGREYAITSIQPVQISYGSAGLARATSWSLAGRKKLMERRQNLFFLRRENRR